MQGFSLAVACLFSIRSCSGSEAVLVHHLLCVALLCFAVAKSHLTMKIVIALLYLSSLFCAVDALKLATREADIDARASDLLLDAKMQAEQMNVLSERVRSLAQEVDAGGETAR